MIDEVGLESASEWGKHAGKSSSLTQFGGMRFKATLRLMEIREIVYGDCAYPAKEHPGSAGMTRGASLACCEFYRSGTPVTPG